MAWPIFGKGKQKQKPVTTVLFDNQITQLASTMTIFKRADEDIKALKPTHPFKNKENHKKLVQHVKQRIQLGRELQISLRERMRVVDQDMNGFVKLDEADRKRKRANNRGEERRPVNMVIPIADAKIDELLTYLMQVFWPNEGMHNAYTSYSTQAIANSFALLMNKHGEFFQHYMKIQQFFYEGLKYNFSILACDWKQKKGTKLSTDNIGGVKYNNNSVLFEGNDLFNIDPYNFWFDPSVDPIYIGEEAEFAGETKMFSAFGIIRLANEGVITNMQNAIAAGQGEQVFYQDHPIVRYDYTTTGQGAVTDWQAWASNRGGAKMNGHEIARGYFKIVPSDFGLSESKELEIWLLGLMNGTTIVIAENAEMAHKRIPYVTMVPRPDNLFMQKKSPAEDLLDLQGFASFLINLHQQSSRKSLFGITVYDSNFVDLKQSEGEVSAHIPTKRSVQQNGKIDDYIKQFRDSPETGTLIDETSKVFEMLETILPTNILKQVTDLDRATTYQAAATVQGTNRRSLKMAKVIDDQAIKPLRFMMMYNIQELQSEVEVIDPASGQPTKILPAKLRELDLAHAIGEGLQSIDKLMIINLLHDVINSILQSAQASEEIDIVSLLNYWTTLIGDRTDLNQFRRTAPTLDQIMKLAQATGIISDAKSAEAQQFVGGLQQAYGGNNQAAIQAKMNGASAVREPGGQSTNDITGGVGGAGGVVPASGMPM